MSTPKTTKTCSSSHPHLILNLLERRHPLLLLRLVPNLEGGDLLLLLVAVGMGDNNVRRLVLLLGRLRLDGDILSNRNGDLGLLRLPETKKRDGGGSGKAVTPKMKSNGRGAPFHCCRC